ncbi:hypothetical protein [Streptomyces sp. NPDC002769]|uniref:hypothetical protein n=1 Tax=Streptomyces sp. NPDC002769 TaxID=3154542 RepID=UPI00331EEB2F
MADSTLRFLALPDCASQSPGSGQFGAFVGELVEEVGGAVRQEPAEPLDNVAVEE